VFKKLDNEKQIKRRIVNGVELVYDYYVVRGRRAAINRSRFTGEVVAELVCTPNAITLYHNIKFLLSDKRDKTKHPAHNDTKHPKQFDYFVNHLCLHVSEKRFIKGINRVNGKKFEV
jgi:hypothetical protein